MSFDLQFRPLNEFLDLNCFKFPAGDILVERVRTNLIYYLANYLALIFTCLLILCISQPTVFIAVILIAAAGLYLFKLNDYKAPLIISDKSFTPQQVQLGFLIYSLLIFSILAGYSGWYSILFGGVLCLIHCLFRQRNIKSKGTAFFSDLKASVRQEVNNKTASLKNK
jgi:Gpi18-like mannosyltransferase